MVLINNL